MVTKPVAPVFIAPLVLAALGASVFIALLVRAAPAASDRALFCQLDRALPEVTLCDCGLGDVLDFMSDLSGAKIEVDWHSLARAGITRETVVTTRIRNQRFSAAMTKVLDSAERKPGVLQFETKDGVIHIGLARQDAALAWKWGLGT